MKTPKLAQRFNVLEFTNTSGTTSYRVTGIKRDGTRIRQNYADQQAAQCRQVELETEYLAGHVEKAVRSTKLTEDQISMAEAAFARLDGADAELPLAIEYWLKHGRHSTVKDSPRLSDAVEKFNTWLIVSNLRAQTRKNLKICVNLFAGVTPDVRMDRVMPETLDAFLETRKDVSAVTRSNNLRALSKFFAWCMERERRWMTYNPAKVVKVAMPTDKPEVPILTVAECEAVLRSAEKFKDGRCVPYVAVCLFGGLRPDEAKRLTWQQVNFGDGEIRLEANQTKTGRARVVTLNATLRAWLEKYQGREFFPSNLKNDFTTVREAAGFGTIHDLKDDERKHLKPWATDVMRHTAISHFFRSCGSYGLTAERHGNSEGIIKAHYQGRVSTEDTKKFYAIMPKKGAK